MYFARLGIGLPLLFPRLGHVPHCTSRISLVRAQKHIQTTSKPLGNASQTSWFEPNSFRIRTTTFTMARYVKLLEAASLLKGKPQRKLKRARAALLEKRVQTAKARSSV